MLKPIPIFFCCLFVHVSIFCQETATDSIRQLGTVIVRGFETGAAAMMVPASVSSIQTKDLQRYGNISLVPAVSGVPGVRMEERSPGSYRLSIRGSLLRSPFGIRNIKVYHGDFILTDAGGNTYLNLLDFNSIGSVEIIRGPASSIYGTGTGGVVHLNAPAFASATEKKHRFGLQFTAASFGLFSQSASWQFQGKKTQWQINQGHLQSDGYRENSAMRRDAVQFNIRHQTGKRNRIDGLLLLSSLNYRTPGGLTQAQVEANPRQARPATPVLPGAVQQEAGIKNASILAGLSDTYQINGNWTWTNAFTMMFSDFENPFISNYETRKEWNIGFRSRINYNGKLGELPIRWITGIEWQQGRYRIDSSGNTGGRPTGSSVQDKVLARQQFAFTQLELEPLKHLLIQAGLSLNDFRYTLERTEGLPKQGRIPLDFDKIWAPRVALRYLFLEGLSMHLSLSKGFSPPSIAEIRPSAGGFRTDLQAEQGWSGEIGMKASAWRGRFHGELTAFQFNLNDAIVRRTNASGAEFFINAGGTKQQGIEAYVEGFLLPDQGLHWLNQIRLWGSVTFSQFAFEEYQSGNADYSGNALTGVPKKAFTGGIDWTVFKHLKLMGTFQYTDPVPLTDANDVYAPAWRLWTVRADLNSRLWNTQTIFFAGIDNLGDGLYSLGNDLNAFGKRYFNPAPTRNFFAGVRVKF